MEDTDMALSDKMRDVPRDPEAMDERTGSSGFLTTIFVLLALVVIAGLFYAFAVGQGPTQRTVNPLSTTELSHSAPQPAAQPTPTP
jgi:hypothetical protein